MKVVDHIKARALISDKDLQKTAKQQISESIKHPISDSLEKKVKELVVSWIRENRKGKPCE